MSVLTLDWGALVAGADPGYTIIIWTVEPGSVTHARLQRLAAIAERRTLLQSP